MNLYSVNVYTNNLSVGDAQTLSIAIKDINNIIIIHTEYCTFGQVLRTPGFTIWLHVHVHYIQHRQFILYYSLHTCLYIYTCMYIYIRCRAHGLA